ncbi:uncharacterized protein RHOBADRAFT_52059 [Rhodotorula graminis WP1]|uniref:Uncharacterized protein n=1 Tax=Rhodotorula graminis (strain WP1) TaxID=578459 RepID=A0A194S946_RHOGW|nr:uncharacterized protein RHOBADRAFT_52059 [Rhodotorula graminis WP1]KPV77104.1 hypothetical protein RHOBADRAFT_52059 [Rhodotorula graminis WP1]
MVNSLALVLASLALGLVSTVTAAPVVAQEHPDVDLAKRSPDLLWALDDLDYGYYGWRGGWKRDLDGHPNAEGLVKRDSFPIEERDVHPAELEKRQFGGYGGGYGGYGYDRSSYNSGYYGAATTDDLAKRSDSPDLEARAVEPVEAAAEPANAAVAEPVDAAAQPAEAYPYYGYRPWHYRPYRPYRPYRYGW